MKISLKSITLGTVIAGMSMVAMAADPIVGTWQTYEDGKPKAKVQISESNGVLSGKIVSGNTAKAKQYVGKTVIKGLKADGNNKYSGGQIIDPVENKSYRLTATLKGSDLALKGHWGLIWRTQNWKKVQ